MKVLQIYICLILEYLGQGYMHQGLAIWFIPWLESIENERYQFIQAHWISALLHKWGNKNLENQFQNEKVSKVKLKKYLVTDNLLFSCTSNGKYKKNLKISFSLFIIKILKWAWQLFDLSFPIVSCNGMHQMARPWCI